MVFSKPFGGIADRAEDFRTQIRLAADPVVKPLLHGVEKKAVHGKIPARRIGLGAGELDSAWASAICVVCLSAEGGNLELMAMFENKHHAKLFSNGNRVRKQRLNLFGTGGRCDIIVHRFSAQQEVAHAAAYPIGFEAGGLEPANNLRRQFAR